MGAVVGVLLIIVILAGIFALRRRARRFDVRQNLTDCQLEFEASDHDLTLATTLSECKAQRSWVSLCRQLGREGMNPALADLTATPDGDEAAARDLFETAIAMLEKVHAKAKENLELAESLARDETEEEA